MRADSLELIIKTILSMEAEIQQERYFIHQVKCH